MAANPAMTLAGMGLSLGSEYTFPSLMSFQWERIRHIKPSGTGAYMDGGISPLW